MKPNSNTNVIAACVTAVIIFTIASCVAIFIAAPDGANTGSLIAIMMASIPANIVAIAALAKVNQVHTDTQQILNGVGQAKVENGIRNVLDERGLTGDTGSHDTTTITT